MLGLRLKLARKFFIIHGGKENSMSDFWLGILIGAVVMDVLWAWHVGIIETVIQKITMKWKLYRARFL